MSVVSIAGAVYFGILGGDELGSASVAFSTVTGLPFVLATGWYATLAITECTTHPVAYRFLVGSIVASALMIAGLNAYPVRTPEDFEFGSPFDQYWYFAPQTHYGFPFPFYRIFDSEFPDVDRPDIEKVLFDPGSLIGDIVFLSFLIYALVSITMVPLDVASTWCHKTKKRQRSNALLHQR